MKSLVAFPFPGRSQRGLPRSYALGMLLHTRASLCHARRNQGGACLGFSSSPPGLMWKGYSRLAESQKKAGSGGVSPVQAAEPEQTAHPARRTGLPHGGIAVAATPGCEQSLRGQRRGCYPGPHPLPTHAEPWEPPERDHGCCPPGSATVLEEGLCTCALA